MSWWLKKKKKKKTKQIVSYSLQKAPWLKPRETHFRFFYCQSYNIISLCCFNRKAEVIFFIAAIGNTYIVREPLGDHLPSSHTLLRWPWAQLSRQVQRLFCTPSVGPLSRVSIEPPPLGGMALAGRDEEPLPLTSPTYCLLFTKPAASTSLRTRIPTGQIEPFLLP